MFHGMNGGIEELNQLMNFADDMPENTCKLMGGFAILVQISMATMALLSLLYKRHIETPKRPILIWTMDTSKQAIAASLVHFTNVFVSEFAQLLGGGESSNNPCVWYFLNLALDTTIGVYILYLVLSATNYVCVKILGLTDIDSGHYGEPPKLYAWFKQLIIFLFSWVWVKLLVVIALILFPFLNSVALSILAFFKGSAEGQIVFTMFVFPLIMNVIQALLTDRIIKGRVRDVETGNQTGIRDNEDNVTASNESISDEERPLVQSIEDAGESSPQLIPSASVDHRTLPTGLTPPLFSSQRESVLQKLSKLFRRGSRY